MKEGVAAIELVEHFADFSNAQLEWEALFPNFGGLRLRAHRDGEFIGRLQFLYPSYIDCGVRMTKVLLRMATREECERVAGRQRWSVLREPERTLVAIDSAEGTFFVWSMAMLILESDELYPGYPEPGDWRIVWPEPPPF
jgi:hypothetical protein